jgi:hypothetical protein
VDTSQCEFVIPLNLTENKRDHSIRVYPSPTEGWITLDLGEHYNRVNLEVFNALGQSIDRHVYGSKKELHELATYFLQHESSRRDVVERCNQLIGTEHTFKKRAEQIVNLAFPGYEVAEGLAKVKTISQAEIRCDEQGGASEIKNAKLEHLAANIYRMRLAIFYWIKSIDRYNKKRSK